MNDLLNPIQKRSLRIALRQFEEKLVHARAWLNGHEENGVLYLRKLSISEKRKQQAEEQIEAAMDLIEKVSRDFDLPAESENAAGLIRGEMAISWADLLDSRANELKRCGQVHPELTGALDPSIERLAGIAFRLTTIFDE